MSPYKDRERQLAYWKEYDRKKRLQDGIKPRLRHNSTWLNNGYFRMQHNGRQEYVHRVVWEEAHGPIPNGHEIHHKDGNRLNNCLENLEVLSRAQHRRIHGREKSHDNQPRS